MRFEYFQMIDRIVALDVGERTVRSVCIVPKESTIFEGHFPGYPLMPGVLQIECMAQTCGWLVTAINRFTSMPFLIGVKEAKFRSPVLPGEELEFDGKIVHEGSGFCGRRMQRTPAGTSRSVKRRSLIASCRSQFRIPQSHAGMGGADRSAGQRARRGAPQVTERREVWITGVGLITCLGEGLEATWSHLERGDPPPYDDKSFAPYIVHPLAPLNFDKQIPKKSDQRQMELWQRIGVYAAGLALGDAGIAGKPELLDVTDMIVAAAGGERDVPADSAILTGLRKVAERAPVPQRAADERSAPYPVSGAASQSPCRQHFDRPRRRRLLAHILGRGVGRRRRGADRAGAHRRRTKRIDAGRRRLSTRPAGTFF